MNRREVIEIADSEDDESDEVYSSSALHGTITAPKTPTTTYRQDGIDIYTDDLPPLSRKSADDTSTSSINCKPLRSQMLAAATANSSTSGASNSQVSIGRNGFKRQGDEYNQPFVADDDDSVSAPSPLAPPLIPTPTINWTQLNHDLSCHSASSPLLAMSANQQRWQHSTPIHTENTPFLADMAGSFVAAVTTTTNDNNDFWAFPTSQDKQGPKKARAKTLESKPEKAKRDRKRANTHRHDSSGLGLQASPLNDILVSNSKSSLSERPSDSAATHEKVLSPSLSNPSKSDEDTQSHDTPVTTALTDNEDKQSKHGRANTHHHDEAPDLAPQENSNNLISISKSSLGDQPSESAEPHEKESSPSLNISSASNSDRGTQSYDTPVTTALTDNEDKQSKHGRANTHHHDEAPDLAHHSSDDSLISNSKFPTQLPLLSEKLSPEPVENQKDKKEPSQPAHVPSHNTAKENKEPPELSPKIDAANIVKPPATRLLSTSPKRPKYRVGLSKRVKVESLHAYLKK